MIFCELNYSDVTADNKLTLKCNGVGNFSVFTGLNKLKNVVNCSHSDNGAIPVGTYYIVERKQHNSIGSRVRNFGIDVWNFVHWRENDKNTWFALYNAQSMSDATDIGNGKKRGGFRLHPVNSDGTGESDGCITFCDYHAYFQFRHALLNTIQDEYWKFKGIKVYGIVRVIGNPDYAKCNMSN